MAKKKKPNGKFTLRTASGQKLGYKATIRTLSTALNKAAAEQKELREFVQFIAECEVNGYDSEDKQIIKDTLATFGEAGIIDMPEKNLVVKPEELR